MCVPIITTKKVCKIKINRRNFYFFYFHILMKLKRMHYAYTKMGVPGPIQVLASLGFMGIGNYWCILFTYYALSSGSYTSR